MPTNQQNTESTATAPAFHRVGENLYRNASSGTYYALVKRGGKQFRRSLKTKDRQLAIRRLTELRHQVTNLTLSEESSAGFDEVAKQWLDSVRHTMKPASILRRESCIRNVAPYFKGVTVRNVSPKHCDSWLADRGRRIAASTFAHELGTMKLAFAFAVSRGLLLANPASHIARRRIPQARINVPTREQFRMLVEAIRDREGRFGSQGKGGDGADLVELLAGSGCRLAEATALRWRDVDFEKDCITVTGGEKGTKNNETRIVPMTGHLHELLNRMKQERQPEPQPEDLVSRIKDAKKCLHSACQKLGFPQFTHHDFRHLFATVCIESGVDIPTVSRWLGHRDGGALAMKVYGHLRQEHSFEMIKRVSLDPKPA